jgi:glycosyltransferase 2 family protein
LKKKLFNALKYLVMLGVGVFLFWFVYRNQFSNPAEMAKLRKAVLHIHYGYILAAFVIMLVSNWSRAVRWNLLIQPLGYKTSDKNGFMAVMIGYLANLAFPRLGEVSRCVVLNRTNNIPIDKLVGTVIVERIFDFICLFIIVGLTLILEFEKIRNFFVTNVQKKLGEGGFVGLLTFFNIAIAVVVIIVGLALLYAFYRRYKNQKAVVKVAGLAKGLLDGMKTVGKMEKKWLFLFHSALIWFLYYMMVYLCFLALSATENLGMVAALTVLVTGSFGFVMPVQGGIGAYHLAVTQTLILYGLSEKEGSIFALVAHTFQMSVFILVGSLSLAHIAYHYRKGKKHESPAANPS